MQSNNKQNYRGLRAAAVLLLCVALTGSLLFSRIIGFTKQDSRLYIPLTQSTGITHVQETQLSGLAPSHQTVSLSNRPMPVLSATWFQAADDNTVWNGETGVEIFRISYENGDAQVTVSSGNGSKVIAPGTENTYSFALHNTAKDPVEFTMEMEAYFSDGITEIPVDARVLSDSTGIYLAGSAESFGDVLELNQVTDSGKLQPGYIMPYTLQWQWPFEGDDVFDTALGNLGDSQEATLTVVIRTVASYTPSAEDGIPYTGDTGNMGLMLVLLICGLAGIILLIRFRPKGESHERA